jgi:membrane-bound lytic murein transglycosylase A
VEPFPRYRILSLILVVTTMLATAAWLRLALRPEPAPVVAAPAPAPPPAAPVEPPPPKLLLEAAAFADLPGWGADAQAEALPALRSSCRQLLGKPPGTPVGPQAVAGYAGAWKPACTALAAVPEGDSARLRQVLEARFTPYLATNRGEAEGLFTGYYEPLLRGSRKRAPGFEVPLYRQPRDLVVLDLGRFKPDLEGRKIAGRFERGQLRPYFDRAEIDGGALAGRGLEVVWVDDPVDAFFLHIQGSGRVALPDGRELRVGYAGQNGHGYVALGKVLLELGALEKGQVSMQTIRAWLEAHPTEVTALLAQNPSYVFFRELQEGGPVGAQGLVLTPERSLAADLAWHPLGVPVWLAATHPAETPGTPDPPLEKLLVIQDTGGAIKGPVRGDVFWGHGPRAEEIAGRMKHRGRLWWLLPNEVRPAGVLRVSTGSLSSPPPGGTR